MALSGGADSAALAWLTSRVGPIRAVHIHHGLAASDALERAARAVAEALAIPIEVLAVTLERFTENDARKARYRALASVLSEGEWILTAHTADDQAETVLANLLRGAGVDGLAGIPSRRGPISRPMLDVTRSETRELATLAGLPWLDDPGNADLGRLRNRIRLQLIPQLEAEFNPAIRRHLSLAARAISETAVVGPDPGVAGEGGWRVPAGVLWAMGSDEAVRSLRPVVRRLRDGYGLDRSESERVWAVACGSAKATELSGGLRVERSGPWFLLSAVDRPVDPPVDQPADRSTDDRGGDRSG
ncbi:MAG: tRNA lysidine(34) synthetase TilS [Acidimicrobiia bacterium]